MICARKQPVPPGPCPNQVVEHTGRGVQPTYCRDPVCVSLRQKTRRAKFLESQQNPDYDADKKILQRCREWLASHERITRRYFCGALAAGFMECVSPADREHCVFSEITAALDALRNGRAAEARYLCRTIRDAISPHLRFASRVRQACNDVLLYAGWELPEVGGFERGLWKLYNGYRESISAWYNGGDIEPARLILALVGCAHHLTAYCGSFRSVGADLKEAAWLLDMADQFWRRLPKTDPRRDSLRTLVNARKGETAMRAGVKPQKNMAMLLGEPQPNDGCELLAVEASLSYWTFMGDFERAAECYSRALAIIRRPGPWGERVKTSTDGPVCRRAVPLMLRWGKWEETEKLITGMIVIHTEQPCASYRRQFQASFREFERAGRSAPDVPTPSIAPSIYGGFPYVYREDWTGDYSV